MNSSNNYGGGGGKLVWSDSYLFCMPPRTSTPSPIRSISRALEKVGKEGVIEEFSLARGNWLNEGKRK